MIAYEKKNNKNGKSLGQYMTPKFVAEYMSSLISKPQSASVLEPGAGEGIFLEVLYEKGFEDIRAYEIDERLGKRNKNGRYTITKLKNKRGKT